MKLYALIVAFALPLGAQTPTVKTTPASETLVSSAKEMAQTQKNLDTAFQQAKLSLDMSQKALNEALVAKSKEFQDEIKADKKYAGKMKELETIQKQIQDAQTQAQQKYQQSTSPMQQKVLTENALIQGLIPIVRKENGLPDTATFDPATQTWKDTAKGAK